LFGNYNKIEFHDVKEREIMSKSVILEISPEDTLYCIKENYIGKEIIPCELAGKWKNIDFFDNNINGFMHGKFLVEGKEICFFAVKYGKGK